MYVEGIERWKKENQHERRKKILSSTNANLIQMCFEIYSVITSKASFDIGAKVKVNENGANGIERNDDNMHENGRK